MINQTPLAPPTIKRMYDSTLLAAGYAFNRPPVHAQILAKVPFEHRVRRALDIGCGAGLSTAALLNRADFVVGIEPAEAMLAHRRSVAQTAGFVVGMGERLPFADASFGLVTAAGSLNYVDLTVALAEVARVLIDAGTFVIYDFSEGRHAREGDALECWFAEFEQRFPWPPGYRPLVVPDMPFADFDLSLLSYERVEVPLALTAEAYTRYVLSEVNVDAALRRGDYTAAEAREWCESTLAAVFSSRLTVMFRGYVATVGKSR